MKSLIEHSPKEASLGAGLLLLHSGKLCLALDRKGISKEPLKNAMRISAIGGGLLPEEAERGDFLGAALREAKEEAGILPEIASAKRTFFIDYDNSVREVKISDAVKPAIIFRRVYLKGPESWQLFSASFIGKSSSRPEPIDLSGLAFLPLSALALFSKGFSTIPELEIAGSHTVLNGTFPRTGKIYPFGTVDAIVSAEKSRGFSLPGLFRQRD